MEILKLRFFYTVMMDIHRHAGKCQYLQFTYSSQAVILRNSFTVTFSSLPKQGTKFL